MQKKKPHTHDTCDEMRKCFANHLKKYHQQRKRQWQQWCEPRVAELVGVECSKCGCFWTGHDTTACQVIGTFNNNLRFFLSTLPPYCVGLAKRVLDQQPERSHRYTERPCPICGGEEFHLWKECFWQAHFQETKLGEGLIKIQDGSHSAIEPYIEITGQGEEMAVTSTLPRCRYCNIKRPHHFWTECTFQKCCYIARLPCYRCGTKSPDHVPEACWALTTNVTLEVCQQGLELRLAVMQRQQQVHLCPVCGVGIYPTGHSVESCVESRRPELGRSGLKFTEMEARWPHYHGDINVSLSRRFPISGQSACTHCQRQHPLHYPYECTGEAAIPRHPCIFCGEKEPKHISEDCPQREKVFKKALSAQEIQKRRHQHQRQLLGWRICYACAEEGIRNGHLERCLEMGEVADGVGYGPIRRRLDLTVTSRLPGCQYCRTPRPLHYPGDCPSAPYLVNRVSPCLICGNSHHVPDKCPLFGTALLDQQNYNVLTQSFLDKLHGDNQCHVCRIHHLEAGEMCLQGKVRATGVCEKFLYTEGHIQDDGSDLSHQVRAEEHREVAKVPSQTRQRNEAGLPLDPTTPEERWTNKKFSKALDGIRQKYQGLSMMTQVGRLLAEQGLERLNEDQRGRIEAAV